MSESEISLLTAEAKQQKPSMATLLAKLVLTLVEKGEAELWFDPATTTPYITIRVDGRHAHNRIGGRDCRDWLSRLAYETFGRVPGGQALSDAQTVLSGHAKFDGAAHDVWVRLATWADGLVLDLVDAEHRAVVVTPTGWQVTTDPPVRFRRTRGMLPLPVPVAGGSLDHLRPLLRLEGEGQWQQICGWLVGALAPNGPYPVLLLLGEQGSGKTTAARLIRNLIDPHVTAVRGPVRDQRDLMIAASHSHVVAFDNLSGIPDWLSDGLCRISTGGGFATRQLFTDDDEHLIQVTRPLLLTSITAVVHRGDLLDRSTSVTLPTMPAASRAPEGPLLEHYEILRPALLGALLDAAVVALRERDGVDLPTLPRMADHVIWVTAAEPALGWPTGAYLAAYTGQQEEAIEAQLDGEPVARAIQQLLRDGDWEGTSSQLFEHLTALLPLESRRQQTGWPRSPRGLTAHLTRLAPDLRRIGVDVSRRHTGKERTVMLRSVSSVSSVSTKSCASAGPEAGINTTNATNGAAQDRTCCKGGPIQLQCKLCPVSATYWASAPGAPQ